MEVISSSYNCRNPFVAGLLPVELLQRGPTSLNRCPSSSITVNNIHRNRKLNSSLCGNKSVPVELNSSGGSSTGISSNSNKSKKAIRNRRVKEAKRRRRYQKHVHFPEDEEMIAVVILVEDTQEIKDTRQMYWEFFAVNRQRFKHRVSRLAEQLEQVLQPEHRERVYRERFSSEITSSSSFSFDCVDQLTQRIDLM